MTSGNQKIAVISGLPLYQGPDNRSGTVFTILAFGQSFRVGNSFLWEGLSGKYFVLSVFPALLAILFLCLCAISFFTGCRKNHQLKVLCLSPLRANEFALDGMAILLSVGDS